MLTATNAAFPLSFAFGDWLCRPESLEGIKTRLTIEVAAITNLQSTVWNHIATDGTIPFLLQLTGHLRERILDVLRYFGVGDIGLKDGVMNDRTVVVGVRGFVVFRPRKRRSLTSVGERGGE